MTAWKKGKEIDKDEEEKLEDDGEDGRECDDE